MKPISLLAFLALTAAAPAPNTDPASPVPCKNPLIRKEWRSLSVDDRKRYIKAVQCLFNKPPISKKYFPVVTNRYEDFVALHANATAGGANLTTGGMFQGQFGPSLGIHGGGVFIPWHRYVVSLYEDTIRSECGWDQAIPYWDWHLDTPEAGGGWMKSPVFDNESGFGGSGVVQKKKTDSSATKADNPMDLLSGLFDAVGSLFGIGGCVESGPFKDIKLHIGPMGRMAPGNVRCLTRSLNANLGELATTKAMKSLLASKTFGALGSTIEIPFATAGDAPFHTIGHGGIAGEMRDLFTSTNDPLFFLHHAGLDRLWAMWQEMDIGSRLYNVSGDNRVFFGLTGATLTLDSPIWMGFAAPDRPVRDVMDTMNRDGKGFLCYKYEHGAEIYA